MGFLNRFNAQTQQLSQSDPNTLPSYLNSTGNVAETGTSNIMGSFFDTVDSYLNQSEQQTLAKAEEFFETAVTELGFDGEIVDVARDNLMGTIR